MSEGLLDGRGIWEKRELRENNEESKTLCMDKIVNIFFKDFIYLFYICNEYIVTVFRHSRREHRISLQMVVSHHVVAGI